MHKCLIHNYLVGKLIFRKFGCNASTALSRRFVASSNNTSFTWSVLRLRLSYKAHSAKSNMFTSKGKGKIVRKRWTDDCEAQRLLKRMFENDEIEDDAAPKAIYSSHAQFYDNYSLDVFRTHFNVLKALHGNYCKISN